MNDKNTLNLKAILQVTYHFENGNLEINVQSSGSRTKYKYACVLLVDNRPVQFCKYQSSSQFLIKINKSGRYRVKGYILDPKQDIRVSKSVAIGNLVVYSNFYQNNQLAFIKSAWRERGKLFLDNQILVYNGLEPYKTTSLSFWADDPFKNNTWRWNVFQLSILNYILSAYSVEKSALFLQKAFNVLESWDNYAQNCPADKALWHDHGTSLRLYNICFFLSYSLKEKFIMLGDDRCKFVLGLIRKHIAVLVDDKFYSKHTNHGFDQSLFLYQACLELEYVLPLTNETEIAADRICDEINYVFCKDGGHKENSPGYLNFGVKQCLSVINVECNYFGSNLRFKYVEKIVNKATKALLHTVKPDGYLPAIGDTSHYKVVEIFYKHKPEIYSEFLYMLTKGAKGTKPKERFYVLNDCGYVFIRSHWERHEFEQAIYFSMKASYLSNYHRHDDDLSVTLYAYGEDWLIDGGIYKYIERDPHRKYIRSYNAHNITAPKNANVARNMTWRPKIVFENSEIQDVAESYLATARTEMFENYIYTRQIEYFKAQEKFVIMDRIESLRNDCENYISRFFFPEDKTVVFSNGAVQIHGVFGSMKMNFFSEVPFKFDLIKKPQKRIQGWISRSKNELFQSVLLEVHFDPTSAPLEFRVELSFT